jgi:cathepsin B
MMLSVATVAFALGAVNESLVHPDRRSQIREINSKTSLWTAAPQERFAAHAPGHSKPLCGVTGNWAEDVAAMFKTGEVVKFVAKNPDAPIPDDFDSETNWPKCAKVIGDIRDQSNCGCCWAFGGAEAASDRMCIATDAAIIEPISAQDVCFCASFNGCGGGQITTPWTHIKSKGAVTGGQFQGSGPFGNSTCSDFSLPHCHHHGPQGSDPYPAEGQPGCESQSSPKCPKKCDDPSMSFDDNKYTFKGQVASASGEKDIQQMIMEGGPVETAFSVYSDFENYAGGIYHHVSGQMMGGHAVRFVGWGVDSGTPYWKVANSWNPYWGEKGYFRIKRGDNEGGIEGGVTGSETDAKWSKK